MRENRCAPAGRVRYLPAVFDLATCGCALETQHRVTAAVLRTFGARSPEEYVSTAANTPFSLVTLSLKHFY